MSGVITIKGDEWTEDELRDLASRPRLDVPVKDEFGRRARLAVHVWQAQHGEGDEEPDDAAAGKTPAPKPETKPGPAGKTEEPYVYAHPCPRCGVSVEGGRKNKLCDSCRTKSTKERVARCMAKGRAKESAPAKKSDRDG